MRKWLSIIAVTGLLSLLIPQTIGFSITRCAHSGHISLAKFTVDKDCGLSSDSDCMQHFSFKVSDYSTANTTFACNLTQFTAILALPVPAAVLPATENAIDPSIQALPPPGTVSHTLLPLRN